jgi:hypothetical protein
MSAVLVQTARHEAAHAVVGFVEGLQFDAIGISVLADPHDGTRVGGAAFYEPWTTPDGWIRSLIAGPLYECLTFTGEISPSVLAGVLSGPTNDARNAASALFRWLRAQHLIADMPLQEMVIDRSTGKLKEWGTELLNHFDSPEWQSALEFYTHFMECLSHSQSDKPALEQAQPASTLALLKWFAFQTRQLLDKHTNTIEALAAELLTEKRLNGDRYIMSGPGLESFLTTHEMREQK